NATRILLCRLTCFLKEQQFKLFKTSQDLREINTPPQPPSSKTTQHESGGEVCDSCFVANVSLKYSATKDTTLETRDAKWRYLKAFTSFPRALLLNECPKYS